MVKWAKIETLGFRVETPNGELPLDVETYKTTVPLAANRHVECHAYEVREKSMVGLWSLGEMVFCRTPQGRAYSGMLGALLSVPGRPRRKARLVRPAVFQMRGIRIARKLLVSVATADGKRKPNERLFEQIEQVTSECICRLSEDLIKPDSPDLPDEAFITRLSGMLRETDCRSKPLVPPASYPEYRDRVLRLAKSEPSAAAAEFRNAQKAKSAVRRLNLKCLMVDAEDLLHHLYTAGMEVLKAMLIEQGHLADSASRGLYQLIHKPHDYLDGIVPALHPIGDLLVRSETFLAAAIRRFEAKKVTAADQAGFYGAMEALVSVYHIHVMDQRDVDILKKRRKRETADSALFAQPDSAPVEDDQEEDE